MLSAARRALVIGSGFGGTMAAHALLDAGWQVTLVERGGWVPRGPENWLPQSVGTMGPHYAGEGLYRDLSRERPRAIGTFHCVGGPSVFYGGVSLRFRERDFEPVPAIDGDSGAAWPFDYAALEPFYDEAERLIGVAGQAGTDPTEPPRSAPFPAAPMPWAPVTERIAGAARDLGLHPFPLPLAINASGRPGRTDCIACATCDGFACAIEAKNDLATTMLRPMQARGLDLVSDTAITRLEHDAGRIVAAHGVHLPSGRAVRLEAPWIVLGAGALATPHLLLASGLDAVNPAGDAVGRYLTRHKNEILLGFFARRPDPERRFHKQLGIHDLYFGAPDGRGPAERLGGLQQLPTPPVALARDGLPWALKPLAPLVSHLTGLLVIAEDQPRRENRVWLGDGKDAVGMPELLLRHAYTARDLDATAVLRDTARRVLRRAGALFVYRHVIDTYSHALGTVRMGRDPRTAPLDGDGAFRGVDNLLVVDGSTLPRAAGVNPSLTIAANALRMGRRLAARVAEDGGRDG